MASLSARMTKSCWHLDRKDVAQRRASRRFLYRVSDSSEKGGSRMRPPSFLARSQSFPLPKWSMRDW